jgi:hypothetical protein
MVFKPGVYMENRLTSLIQTDKGIIQAELFGYSSKGTPGIEIVGDAKFTRALKEKMIYLCKTRGLHIPFKRYVIVMEFDQSQKLRLHELKWLELPILLIFWSLADILPIKSFRNCVCTGSIDISGKIEYADWVSAHVKNDVIVIGCETTKWERKIVLQDLISHIPEIEVSSAKD